MKVQQLFEGTVYTMGQGNLVGLCQDTEDYIEIKSNSLKSLEGGPRVVTGYFFAINCSLTNLEHLPVEIRRDFNVSNNQITTLVGMKNTTFGTAIDVSQNKLTSLDGTPSEVHGSFYCVGNQLTTLEDGPRAVHGQFKCGENKLTSLKGAPKVLSAFICNNNKLTTLEGIQSEIHGNFNCEVNDLTSLEHAPSIVHGNFDCAYNNLTSLKNVHKHIKQIDGNFYLEGNEGIRSNVLGVLLIKNLFNVSLSNVSVERILNKYLPNDRGMEAVFECQEQLIENGLEAYAEL